MALIEFYPWIKALHVLLVIASGGLFAGRGLGVLMGAQVPLAPPLRWLSMAIDTALLLAAVLLLAALQFAPLSATWLQAKLVLLVAYVVLGTLALRRARSPHGRLMAYIGALLCFVAMLAIAHTHDAGVLLRWLGG